MDPFAPRLPAGFFHPEAYTAPDRPPRPAQAGPGAAREVDRDRRPSQPAYGEATVELGFADLLDVVNPLQHIPLVGDIYRTLTGDAISAPARVAGGAIFGGPLGFVSGIVNAVAAEVAGQNLGESAIAAVFGGGAAEPALARAAAPTDAPAAASRTVAAVPTSRDGDGVQQPLTGAAALQALGADLRLAGTRSPAAAPAAAGNDPYPAPPLEAAFSQRMLEGLDKYKALVTERQAPSATPARPVDTLL